MASQKEVRIQETVIGFGAFIAFGEMMAASVQVTLLCMIVATAMLTTVVPVRANSSPGWSPFELIENNNVGDAMFHDLAMNEDGVAVAVWQQANGTRTDIWANEYMAGEGWGEAEIIESDDTESTYEPEVAVDKNGNAIAVWNQYNSPTTSYIWTNRYVFGEGWGTARPINASAPGYASYPEIAFDGGGNALAVWTEFPHIHAARYSLGTGWSDSRLIEQQDGSAQPPSLAVDEYGNAVAVWSDKTGERYSIWSNLYVAGSGWGTEELVENNDSGDAWEPTVAIDDDGSALVVWRQSDLPYTTPSPSHVWSNRYVAGEGWGTAELREAKASENAYGPTVAAFGSGDAIAAWYEEVDSVLSVWTSRYSIVQGWSSPELLDGYNHSFSHSPELAVNQGGRAVIVWQNYSSFFSSRCTIGTGWTQPELVMSHSTAGPQHHRVAIDRHGNGVTVWFMNDTIRYSMYASTYTAPPPSILLTTPLDDSVIDVPLVVVSGATDPYAKLVVNGLVVAVEPNGSFATSVALSNGSNQIRVVATDSIGRPTTVFVNVTYQDPVSLLQDELKELERELNDTIEDLNSAEERLLIMEVVSAAAIISACVLAVLYVSLRGKTGSGSSGSKPPAQP